MKKSELKTLIKAILTEVIAAKKQKLAESKAYSGYKEAPTKGDNTQMGSDDKSITSTDKPVEKEEGKKLPVKDKKNNTEKDHFVKEKSTNPLKEDILSMIREALDSHRNEEEHGRVEEMAKKAISYDGKKLTGSISNNLRTKNPKSPTGWALNVDYKLKDGKIVKAGTPVDAPSLTGKNYIAKGIAGMGRPKASAQGTPSEASELTVSLQSQNGKTEPLEFDFLNSAWPQAKSFLESEVMSSLGDDSLDPNVKIGQEVYDTIEAAKEADLDGKLNDTNNKIILYFDPASKQLRAKKSITEGVHETDWVKGQKLVFVGKNDDFETISHSYGPVVLKHGDFVTFDKASQLPNRCVVNVGGGWDRNSSSSGPSIRVKSSDLTAELG